MKMRLFGFVILLITGTIALAGYTVTLTPFPSDHVLLRTEPVSATYTITADPTNPPITSANIVNQLPNDVTVSENNCLNNGTRVCHITLTLTPNTLQHFNFLPVIKVWLSTLTLSNDKTLSATVMNRQARITLTPFPVKEISAHSAPISATYTIQNDPASPPITSARIVNALPTDITETENDCTNTRAHFCHIRLTLTPNTMQNIRFLPVIQLDTLNMPSETLQVPADQTLSVTVTYDSKIAISFSPFPTQTLHAGDAPVSASYTLTMDPTTGPRVDSVRINQLPLDVTASNNCPQESHISHLCKITFTLTPKTEQKFTFSPVFTLLMRDSTKISVQAPPEQAISATVIDDKNVNLDITLNNIHQEGSILWGTYEITNEKSAFPFLDSIDMTQPDMKIYQNNCQKIAYQHTCSIIVSLDLSKLTTPLLFPTVTAHYLNYHYEMHDIRIPKGYSLSGDMIKNSAQFFMLSKNTTPSLNESNQFLLQKQSATSNWERLNLDFSHIQAPDLSAVKQPTLTHLVATDTTLYGILFWIKQDGQLTQTIASTPIGSNEPWVNLGTPPEYNHDMVVYIAPDKNKYLIVASGDDIWSLNLSNPSAPYEKTFSYDRALDNKGVVVQARILLSPLDKTLYYFTRCKDGSRDYLVMYQIDLTKSIKPLMQGKLIRSFSVSTDDNTIKVARQGVDIYSNYSFLKYNKENGFSEIKPLPENIQQGQVTAIAANEKSVFLATNSSLCPLIQTNDGGTTWTPNPIKLPENIVQPLKSLEAMPDGYLKIIDSKDRIDLMPMPNA